MNKIMRSLVIVAAVAVVAGLGSYALWSDNESSDGNSIAAGSLDLQVGGADLTGVPVVTVVNAYPGMADTTAFDSFINNAGSIAIATGVDFSVSTVADVENGILDPEAEAGDVTDPAGELCGQLQVRVLADMNDDGDLLDAGDVVYNWGTLTALEALGSVSLGALDAVTGLIPDRLLKIEYRVPGTADNTIMTDSCTFDMDFDGAQ